jgi:hypothetical protein
MQTIKIKKASTLDEWGMETPGSATTYKCRLDENSEMVRDREGKESVARAVIMLKGLVKVAYTDTIEYKNELGITTVYAPLAINVIRDFAGKPIFTKVVV